MAAKSSREKMRDYRDRQRARGLRLVQMWLPDTSTEEFKREARRQSLLVAQSPGEADNIAFIDSLFELDDEE